jgi:hypothetical protein
MTSRFLSLCLVCVALAADGCELIADFDRDKIPTDGGPTRDGAPPPTRDATSDADIAEDAGGDDAGS